MSARAVLSAIYFDLFCGLDMEVECWYCKHSRKQHLPSAVCIYCRCPSFQKNDEMWGCLTDQATQSEDQGYASVKCNS